MNEMNFLKRLTEVSRLTTQKISKNISMQLPTITNVFFKVVDVVFNLSILAICIGFIGLAIALKDMRAELNQAHAQIDGFTVQVSMLADSLNSKTSQLNTCKNQLLTPPVFIPEEWASPDNRSTGKLMDSNLVHLIEAIRLEIDPNMSINSAYRTFGHNLLVGGATNSAHKSGKAADVSVRVRSSFIPSDNKRYEIVKLAMKYGANQIGIHKNFIHIGYDTTKNSRLWLY